MKNKNTEDHNCGNCFFCLSKCPECKSTDIRVRFRIDFGYENVDDNELGIDVRLEEVEIECNDCNGLFEYGTWGSNEYKDLYKLGELFKSSLIGDDICCTIDEKGKVRVAARTSIIDGDNNN